MMRIHYNLTPLLTTVFAVLSVLLAVFWPGWREELRAQTYYNLVTDNFGTVGGGNNNQAGNNSGSTSDKPFGTVAGGFGNIAGGAYATVPGGFSNSASGDFGLAAGRRAKALHTGSFVWADTTEADFTSTANNQFLIRALGGVGIGTPAPTQALDVLGNVKVTGGGNGIIFPDGSSLGSADAARVRGITYLAGCDNCGVLDDADDQRTIYANFVGAMTINSVTCFSDAGTPTINLQRDDGTLGNVLNSDLVCESDSNGATSTNIAGSESVLNLDDKLDFVMVIAGGVAKRLTVVVKATVQ